jgi:predicted nucleic acid-binding protein
MCLPVYQEILQGIRDETAFRSIKESLDSALMIEDPMERSLFQEAAGLHRMARRQGYTIRSEVDCLIAACAIRHNIPILHRDRDYGDLAKVSELVEHCL